MISGPRLSTARSCFGYFDREGLYPSVYQRQRQWDALSCKHYISDKELVNYSPYFTALQPSINNLETQRSYKTTDNRENLNFFLKNLSSALKIIRLFVKAEQNVYKTVNRRSASIHTSQILLSRNRLKLSPWSFTHVFKKLDWNYSEGEGFKSALLSSFFNISNHEKHKNIPKYLDNALTDFVRTIPTCHYELYSI